MWDLWWTKCHWTETKDNLCGIYGGQSVTGQKLRAIYVRFMVDKVSLDRYIPVLALSVSFHQGSTLIATLLLSEGQVGVAQAVSDKPISVLDEAARLLKNNFNFLKNLKFERRSVRTALLHYKL